MSPNNHLLRCGMIFKVKLNKCSDKIRFCCENFAFTLVAKGECCSHSSFIELDDYPMQMLVGKQICSIDLKSHGSYGSELKEDIYVLTLKDCSTFHFAFRNYSNGYYDGWISVEKFEESGLNRNETFVSNSQSNVTLILGLPASGKSTCTYNNFPRDVYSVYNDCFRDPLFKFHLVADIQEGKQIVLNDPRLCIQTEFVQVYEQILRLVESSQQISIVCFDNNPTQCVHNHKNRWQYYDSERDCSEIVKFSSQYTDTIEFIHSTFIQDQIKCLPVFKVEQKPDRPPPPPRKPTKLELIQMKLSEISEKLRESDERLNEIGARIQDVERRFISRPSVTYNAQYCTVISGTSRGGDAGRNHVFTKAQKRNIRRTKKKRRLRHN